MTGAEKDESGSLEHHYQNTSIIYFEIENKELSIAKLKCLTSENDMVSDFPLFTTAKQTSYIHKNQLESIWLKVIAKLI